MRMSSLALGRVSMHLCSAEMSSCLCQGSLPGSSSCSQLSRSFILSGLQSGVGLRCGGFHLGAQGCHLLFQEGDALCCCICAGLHLACVPAIPSQTSSDQRKHQCFSPSCWQQVLSCGLPDRVWVLMHRDSALLHKDLEYFCIELPVPCTEGITAGWDKL